MNERALRNRNGAAVSVQGLTRQDDGAAREPPHLTGRLPRPHGGQRKRQDLLYPAFGLKSLAPTAEIKEGARRRADRASGKQGAGSEAAGRQLAADDHEGAGGQDADR